MPNRAGVVNPSIRERHAALTRRAIVDAARSLFRRQGYTATTVEEIAAEAGVGVSTVYAILANKRSILAEIRWQAVQAAGLAELTQAVLGESDPPVRINRLAALFRQLYVAAGDVFVVQRAAADADAEVADTWARVRAERGDNLDEMLKRIQGHYRKGLSPQRALDIVQALVNHDLYAELVDVAGWRPDEYEAWLARTLRQQLLGTL
jgi:AcrR family transcriptional regulator